MQGSDEPSPIYGHLGDDELIVKTTCNASDFCFLMLLLTNYKNAMLDISRG